MADLTEAASDLSFKPVAEPLLFRVGFEDLGLSDFNREDSARLSDRDDSFVSDLLNEGSDSKAGPSPFPSAPRFLEGVLPISTPGSQIAKSIEPEVFSLVPGCFVVACEFADSVSQLQIPDEQEFVVDDVVIPKCSRLLWWLEYPGKKQESVSRNGRRDS
jgi:hypothetical protein